MEKEKKIKVQELTQLELDFSASPTHTTNIRSAILIDFTSVRAKRVASLKELNKQPEQRIEQLSNTEVLTIVDQLIERYK